MKTKSIEDRQNVVTKSQLNKAVLEAREKGKVIARKEIGNWIESNIIDGPKDNPYTTFFAIMAKRLKQGKRL
ncbi:MAG: hypothetical protein P8105_00240 [Dehalococcoidia bacterium]